MLAAISYKVVELAEFAVLYVRSEHFISTISTSILQNWDNRIQEKGPASIAANSTLKGPLRQETKG
jgi:hypothetical protein